MATHTLAVKDALGATAQIAFREDEFAVLTAIHLEDADQRADLKALLTTLATNAKLEEVRALVAGTVKVSATALPLPTGAATDASLVSLKTALGSPLQAGGAVSITASALPTGAATDAKVEAVRALLAGTLAVSASALPLPTGAATSAKQDTGITSLAAIATSVAGTLKSDTVVQATSTNKGASVGTTASVLIAANSARRGFVVQNQSTTATIYINGLGTATADYNSLAIGPGGFYETQLHHIGTGAISIIASAASTPVYAREF